MLVYKSYYFAKCTYKKLEINKLLAKDASNFCSMVSVCQNIMFTRASVPKIYSI